MTDRKRVSSGAIWEDIVGYSRAIKTGNTIEVSGTAPILQGKVAGETAYEQTKVCLEIIEKAIKELGATLNDVVRTRIYVTDISLWEEVGRAHGEYFLEIKPASTMVEISALVGPGMLVEIEATAVVDS